MGRKEKRGRWAEINKSVSVDGWSRGIRREIYKDDTFVRLTPRVAVGNNVPDNFENKNYLSYFIPRSKTCAPFMSDSWCDSEMYSAH